MRLLPLLFLAFAATALADGGVPTQPYIYVQGSAEIEKPADMVQLRFSILAVKPDQPAANAEIQARAKKVLALLDATGIAQRDVEAGELEVEPQFEGEDEETPRPGGMRKIVGYHVKRGFAVKLRDLSKFAKLVDDLLALPIDEFEGINERLSNEKELRSQARGEAIANARKDAEQIAAASGVKVGRVFGISPIPFGEIYATIFGAAERSVDTMKTVVSGEHADPRAYRFAPVVLSERVHVIYLIEPPMLAK